MHVHTEQEDGGRVQRYCVMSGTAPLPVGDAITGWCEDEAFRQFFVTRLARCPFRAFFWEMPAVRSDRLDAPFEFVLVDSPALARITADAEPFARQFSRARGEVAVFSNLSGDATLIAPCPAGVTGSCGHLARFSREADDRLNSLFWRSIGVAVHERLSDAPLWISTSGLGVHWMHVRLDTCPKYYTYQPYRNPGPDS